LISVDKTFDGKDFILLIFFTEFQILTFLAGGVPQDFSKEKSVLWLKKG